MPGRLRCRKRKNGSQSRGSGKACPGQTLCAQACPGQTLCAQACPGQTLCAQACPGQTLCAQACPGQTLCVASVDSKVCVSRSGISCECEQWSNQRRCSASPQPQLRPDKENQQGALSGAESMDSEDYKTLFPDDDSNHVLPVEQFFGNMDTLQDFPQRPSVPSTSVQRAQRRRRYYAPEDSEDSEDEHGGRSPLAPDCPHQQQDCPQHQEDCPQHQQDCPLQRH